MFTPLNIFVNLVMVFLTLVGTCFECFCCWSEVVTLAASVLGVEFSEKL